MTSSKHNGAAFGLAALAGYWLFPGHGEVTADDTGCHSQRRGFIPFAEIERVSAASAAGHLPRFQEPG